MVMTLRLCSTEPHNDQHGCQLAPSTNTFVQALTYSVVHYPLNRVVDPFEDVETGMLFQGVLSSHLDPSLHRNLRCLPSTQLLQDDDLVGKPVVLANFLTD